MDIILTAADNIFTFQNMLFMTVAIFLGIIGGALPGFSATMAVALMVPFTFTMDTIPGLVTIGALYAATIFGGAFSAILLNTPGTPSSIATCFDGYPMAKQGRGEEALYTASVASSFGGVIGTFILVLFALPLARFSLRFGPPEFFWTAIFGLTIIASLSSEAMLKGFAGGLVGIMISMIGLAPIGGDIRFNLGMVSLQGGVELVSVLIGFFCIPEVFRMASTPNQKQMVVDKVRGSKQALIDAWRNVVCHMGNTMRSSIIGALIGILPGAGGNISNIVAYNEAKRAAKNPETFGKGNAQGVVATESANNATVEGALVPLLAMGIPGSPPAAIIFGALLMQGITPGPELFSKNGDITYAFMFSFFVCNILMAVFGILTGKYIFRLVTKIPSRCLIPGILLLTIVGSYAIRNNGMDVIIMFVSGLVGYYLKELEFDPGPIVLGLILGPIAERGFVQGLLMGGAVSQDAPWIIFFTRPLCIVLIVLSLLSISWPLIKNILTVGAPAVLPRFAMNSRFNIDTLGGLSILAIVAFFFLQLGDDFTPFGLFFPERILPILTLLGALILAKGLLRPSGNLKGVFQINKTMVISMVTGAAWALLLVPVGFILASFLSMFFLLMIYIPKGERTLKRALTNGVGSLICVLFFYYVFVQFLGVTLPDGSLFMD